jgi:NAD(P)-dependent dehydrogenase (short-subunit alcohol dehydrogenase family)
MSDETTVALVTGSNRGIGHAIVEQLAARGMTVFLGSRSLEQGEAAAAAVGSSAGEVIPVELDVTDPVTIGAAAALVDKEFGRLDVLINNAGISGGLSAQSPTEPDMDVVRAVFETNVFGVLRVVSGFMPLLRRAPAGRIVNVTSSLGSLTLLSDPAAPTSALPPSAAYMPSKTALNSLTVQLAKELRDTPIKVNAADPGPCDTDFTRGTSFKAPRTAAQGAAVAVGLATLGPDGPTGGVFSEAGQLPW